MSNRRLHRLLSFSVNSKLLPSEVYSFFRSLLIMKKYPQTAKGAPLEHCWPGSGLCLGDGATADLSSTASDSHRRVSTSRLACKEAATAVTVQLSDTTHMRAHTQARVGRQLSLDTACRSHAQLCPPEILLVFCIPNAHVMSFQSLRSEYGAKKLVSERRRSICISTPIVKGCQIFQLWPWQVK